MKPTYWGWLILNLIKAWKFIKRTPFVIWDIVKLIYRDLKKVSCRIIKGALAEIFSWENICVGTGSIFLMGLIFWWVFVFSVSPKMMIPWGIAEVILFLISTYAYWRGKPNE